MSQVFPSIAMAISQHHKQWLFVFFGALSSCYLTVFVESHRKITAFRLRALCRIADLAQNSRQVRLKYQIERAHHNYTRYAFRAAFFSVFSFIFSLSISCWSLVFLVPTHAWFRFNKLGNEGDVRRIWAMKVITLKEKQKIIDEETLPLLYPHKRTG